MTGVGAAGRDNLTESQKKSAYFSTDSGYDPLVYENTPENYAKIVGMLLLFYTWNGLHWWANFELGVHKAEMSTLYNICIFASAVFIIALMLMFGALVNRTKLTHEFYQEKISEER